MTYFVTLDDEHTVKVLDNLTGQSNSDQMAQQSGNVSKPE